MNFINSVIKEFTKMKNFIACSILIIFAAVNTSIAQQNMHNTQKADSTLKLRRQMIHKRSPMVMPFNMNKVTHYFIDTDTGGILRIKSKDPKDETQIKLIRSHLKKEHRLFSEANFKDPKMLHGDNMPGLKILSASKDKYKVDYKNIPTGAQLTFTSSDQKVIKAFHVWFAAQLKDHGSDAKSN